MLCRLCHQIDNVMEDIYVNALQRQMLGGLYAQGINLGNQMIAEDAISINEQKNENYPRSITVSMKRSTSPVFRRFTVSRGSIFSGCRTWSAVTVSI